MADLKVAVAITGSETLSPAAGHAAASLDKLEGSAQRSHSAVSVLATGLAGPVVAAAAAVASGLAFAATSAAAFEKSISATAAVTGASAEEMAQLSALALQLGKDTSFSAKEAADGLGELAKGGVSVSDIMGGAATAALNLAAAGGVSVADAAAIAATSMALFNIEGSKTANVADKIAGFANATVGSVTDFKFAMAAAGAVAKLAGQSFDDTAIAISLMGQAGILGSDAGTSLKTFLNNLIPTTKSATEAMRELGIITADGSNQFIDAQGNFKSFRDIAEVLNVSTRDLTESQRALKLETIFGSDAIRAAAIIAQAGAEGWDTMAESMDKVTAASVAAVRLDNVAGSVEQLSGSVDTAAIMLGQQLAPTLREATEAATVFLNTAVIPFIEEYGPAFSKQLQDTARFLGMVGEAVTPVANVAMPLFRKQLDSVGEGLDRNIDLTYRTIVAAVDMKNAVGDAFQAMGTAVHGVLDELGPFVVTTWGDIQTKTGLANDAIRSKVNEVWTAIPEDIRADLEIIGARLVTKTGEFLATTQAWLTGTQNSTESSWSATSGTVTTQTNAISATVTSAFSSLGTRTREMWNVVESAVSEPLATAYASVTTFVSNVGTSLQGLAATMLIEATAIGANIVQGIINGITGGIDRVKGAAGDLARSVLTTVRSALDERSPSHEMEGIGDLAIQGLILGMQARAGDVLTTAQSIVGDLLSAIVPDRALVAATEQAIASMVARYSTLDEAVTEQAAGAVNGWVDQAEAARRFEADFGTIAVGVAGGYDAITQAANATTAAATTAAAAVNAVGSPGNQGGGPTGTGGSAHDMSKTPFVLPKLGIKAMASGSPSFAGGWSVVGEQGPELMRLPQGTQILSNAQSRSMMADSIDYDRLAGSIVKAQAQHPIMLDGDNLNRNNRTRDRYFSQSNLPRGVGALV